MKLHLLRLSGYRSKLEEVMRDEATAPRDKINAANSWLDRTGVARSSTVALKDETPVK
jgi:hypothetical protein